MGEELQWMSAAQATLAADLQTNKLTNTEPPLRRPRLRFRSLTPPPRPPVTFTRMKESQDSMRK